MFGAKRQPEQKPEDYTKWQEDFGFLNLILNRKKNITKQYVINVYSNQKSETDYMTDDELEPIIENIVKECIEQIGKTYQDFLIKKYFGTFENLISYISEDVYVDIITDAINRNIGKIKSGLQKKIINNLSNLNINK